MTKLDVVRMMIASEVMQLDKKASISRAVLEDKSYEAIYTMLVERMHIPKKEIHRSGMLVFCLVFIN